MLLKQFNMHSLFVLASTALMGVVYGVVVLKKESYLRLPNQNGSYVINSKTARESAFDDMRNYLYVVGYDTAMLHVIDLSTPTDPKVISNKTFNADTDGRPLDVELCRASGKNPTLAITFEGQTSVANEGHLVLYRLYESPSDTLTPINPADPRITVGPHPDNMKFTSDCRRLVISNEGEPRVVEGTFVDPEGTVTIITFNDNPSLAPFIAMIDFRKYNSPAEYDPLLAQGVRYWLRHDPTDFSKLIEFSQCVEPEYVALSPSNRFAYVTLQENNAIARIDIENNIITNIYPMGNKSWEFLTLDASDRDNGAFLKRRKVHSFYQPDKIAFFEWGTNSVPYLVTTDEGRPTAIPGTLFDDYARASTIPWNVNDNELESDLNTNTELGRAYMSTEDGFETTPNTPFLFGGRGFSIWNTESMARTWESGDELERYSRQYFPDTFNGNSASFNQTPPQEADTRSTWMGPEVSTVGIGNYEGRTVMVLGSGRNGLLYVYSLQPNIENPNPEFQSMHRAGDIDATWSTLYARGDMGDAIISDIKFISSGVPKVIVTSEASGSVSIYTLDDETWPPSQMADEPDKA